jgi:hypothetical protein
MLQNFSTGTYLSLSFRLLYQTTTRSCSLSPNAIEALALPNSTAFPKKKTKKTIASYPPKPVTKHPKPQQLYSPSAWKTDCRRRRRRRITIMMIIVRLVPYTAEQKIFLHKCISLPEHSSSSSSSSSSYNNSNVHEPRHSAQKRHQTMATGTERRVPGRGGRKKKTGKKKKKTKEQNKENDQEQ